MKYHIINCKNFNGFKNVIFLMKENDFRLKGNYGCEIVYENVKKLKRIAISNCGKVFKIFSDCSVKEITDYL